MSNPKFQSLNSKYHRSYVIRQISYIPRSALPKWNLYTGCNSFPVASYPILISEIFTTDFTDLYELPASRLARHSQISEGGHPASPAIAKLAKEGIPPRPP